MNPGRRVRVSPGTANPSLSGPGVSRIVRVTPGSANSLLAGPGVSRVVRVAGAAAPEKAIYSARSRSGFAYVWPVAAHCPSWSRGYTWPEPGPLVAYSVDWTGDYQDNGFTVTDQTDFGSWPWLAVDVQAYVSAYPDEELWPPGDVDLLRNGVSVASAPLSPDPPYPVGPWTFSAIFSWYGPVSVGDTLCVRFPAGPYPTDDQPMVAFDLTIGAGYGFTRWMAGRSYVVDDTVLPTVSNGFGYRALNAGVSGNSEPAWPTTLDATVVDGEVTWVTVAGY